PSSFLFFTYSLTISIFTLSLHDALPIWALENQMACVTSPTIGDAPWSPAVDRNNGAAGIFVPSEHGVSDTGVLAEGGLNSPGWVDRKSTRLNSSHVKISYAVFCLKKKNR